MSPINILIVDDIYTNLILIGYMIDDLGYKYKTATNGKEAIEKIKTTHFDIVFLDIEMPIMNGIDAIKIIRKDHDRPEKIPIIGITAHNIIEKKESLLNLGFSDIISKPLEVDTFKQLLSKHIFE